MTSKSWSKRSARACGIISLLALGPGARAAAQPVPAVALIDAADAPQWQTWTKDLGWRVLVPTFPAGAPANPPIDMRVQAIAAAVGAAIQDGSVDAAHVYLAGRGEAAAAVFYTISRVPDLWAGGVALGGSAQQAIDSGRIFAVNFSNAPVLWISNGPQDRALAERLKGDGLNIEWRSTEGLPNSAVFEWLDKRRRDPFPAEIDCETNSPNFARCYWIQMDKFDTGELNDVLPPTFLKPEIVASLELGSFSYNRDDPGPGVLVNLPDKYTGPLKKGDRLVAIDGREVADAHAYTALMAKVTGEKSAAVMVQRGKERVRIETRFSLPHVEAPMTARVQAKYEAADNDIVIASRTVKELRVTIPPQWAMGTRLYWNGLVLENIQTPGCLALTIDKELMHAQKCP